ncbi:MAG: two-component system response regulator AtoC [Bradymonadia bacterium]|jgi:two-component system response regulator AtoC
MAARHRIIICDDDHLIRLSISAYLERFGFATEQASNGQECLDAHAREPATVILLDLRMPVMDGVTCMRELRRVDPDVPVLIMTAYSDLTSAIETTKLGAAEFLMKPTDLAQVVELIQRVVHEQGPASPDDSEVTRYGTMLGNSAAMCRLFDRLKKLETIDAPTVMIQGESGTGKDLAARAIHAYGPRRNGPFMEVDCTALPKDLVEATLFGNEKGAFTDAKERRLGLLESASGGVVFLDEIGELPSDAQSKLLRALENREFKRVGGSRTITLDAAVICATNRDLKLEVKERRFRQDLFYRLAVVEFAVPPLRDRGSDVRMLAEHLLRRYAASFEREVEGFSADAIDALERYDWPGNVRELRNVVERTVIFQEHPVIREVDLPQEVRARVGSVQHTSFTLPDAGVCLDEVERTLIEQALERSDGNQSQSAKLLNLSRAKLRYRMKRHGLLSGDDE